MCTHFFRLTTARLCARGLTPSERDGAIQVSGTERSPLRFFKLRYQCLRPCDFFHFYVLVYPSRGVVHFFYYRSEFQSRFCRVGLKAGERAFCIAFLLSTRVAGGGSEYCELPEAGGRLFVRAHVVLRIYTPPMHAGARANC